MKKVLLGFLTFFITINFVKAENIEKMLLPTVYTAFDIGYKTIHIEGLWKDLNNYNQRVSAIRLVCVNDVCAEKQANLILLGYPEHKPLLLSDENDYLIVQKDNYNLKLKSTTENYEGYIYINLKTKDVTKVKKYKHQKEVDKYKLITTQECCDEEIQRIFNLKNIPKEL